MATENLEKDMKDLKAKLQDGKVIVGKERVLKHLREKTLAKVFMASNCPKTLKEDIANFANLTKVPVIELSLNNEELGLFCKKNFFIAVLATTE
ncbi:MAG: ribosomal L7Ae/L30e/S12e/Gadd45 family protein [Nanoarchaeota archaeon]|nr:ribosomal L7Ae/L30e/S12e/Gadd45 family protein [Nanoarchaeota archaeon]